MKENERDHFLEILCKEGTRIQLDKNQYFSSIINHENTAYCLISGVCALLRFTQNGEEIIYHYFRDKDDLQMFKLLLGVTGVGPKAALGVLAGITADELRFAILSDDVKTLSKAPGIGKKTAQKLILELKDKMKLEDAFELKLAHEQERAAVGAGEVSDGRQEAVEALVALGYSSADALRAVRKVTDVPPDDVEGLLKAALKNF